MKSTPGAKVENNKFCVSVHYRCVEEKVFQFPTITITITTTVFLLFTYTLMYTFVYLFQT
jgi:trehalose-6-phosphatase